jgi:hypothetical protein
LFCAAAPSAAVRSFKLIGFTDIKNNPTTRVSNPLKAVLMQMFIAE